MLKYLLGFALVFSLAVYVAIQDEHAAHQSAQEPQQPSNSVVPAVPDANHPQQNVENAERNLPSWYGFFRWPNGTTTWAILLTLLALAEQTSLLREYVTATKDGVEATRRNIALQFRPELIVRRAELEFGSLEIGGKPAKLHYTVANIGGTVGRITKLYGAFSYWNAPGFWGNPSLGNRISPDAYAQRIDMQLSVSLRAGEDQTLTIEADQTMFDKVKFVQMRSGHNVTNPALVGEIRICAEIHYIDGEKITRKTGIYRWLDIETMRFKPIDDKEYEYAD